MDGKFSEKRFGRLVQLTLLSGVLLCLALFLAGAVLGGLKSPLAGGFFTAGVLTLLLTPAARVLMLVYGFYRMREYPMAVSAFAVLAMLLVAFLL